MSYQAKGAGSEPVVPGNTVQPELEAMLEILSSLGIGALAAAILYGCYRAVEWRSP